MWVTYGWDDNIESDLKQIECEGMDCIQLAWNRVQWWAPGSVKVRNFLAGRVTIKFPAKTFDHTIS
jgi:hypothetical protein